MARQRWRAPSEVLWLQALATQAAWRADANEALVAGLVRRQGLGGFDAGLDAATVALRAAVDEVTAAKAACDAVAGLTPDVVGPAYQWVQRLKSRLGRLQDQRVDGVAVLAARLGLRAIRVPRVRAVHDKLRVVLPEIRTSSLATHAAFTVDGFLDEGDVHERALDRHETEIEQADAARGRALVAEDAARAAVVALLRDLESAVRQDHLDHGGPADPFPFLVIGTWLGTT